MIMLPKITIKQFFSIDYVCQCVCFFLVFYLCCKLHNYIALCLTLTTLWHCTAARFYFLRQQILSNELCEQVNLRCQELEAYTNVVNGFNQYVAEMKNKNKEKE